MEGSRAELVPSSAAGRAGSRRGPRARQRGINDARISQKRQTELAPEERLPRLIM